MLMFAALATALVLAPSANAQICSPGRLANGCPNYGGDGYYFSGPQKCLGLTDVATCKSQVAVAPADLGTTYASILLCPQLLLSPTIYTDANGAAFMYAKWDGKAFVDLFDATKTVATPAGFDTNTCTGTSIYLTASKITLADGITKVSYACAAASKLICVSPTTASPDIDAAWSSWQTTCSGDCASKAGVSRKVRLCNNAAATSNNGKNTCTGTNVGTATTINGIINDIVIAACDVTAATAGCSVAVSVGGTTFNTAYSFTNGLKTVDTFTPIAGQVCTSAIPDFPVAVRNPYVFYETTGKNLWVCGNIDAVWQCRSLNIPTAKVWSAAQTTTNDHPNQNVIYLPTFNVVVFCGIDKYMTAYTPNDYFDVAANTWKAGAYLPVLDVSVGGGSGCVIQDNYLYLFGGRRIDTIVNNPGLIAARLLLQRNGGNFVGGWEILLKNVPSNVVNPSVLPNPSYPNQLIVIPDYGPSQGQGPAYTYDIPTNTLTTSSIGSSVVYEGTDFGKVCTDNNIYDVGGAGAYLFTPATAVANANPILQATGTLTNITNVPGPTRSYSSYAMVPAATLRAANFIPATCTGC